MQPDLPVAIGDAQLKDALTLGMARVEDQLLTAVATDNALLAATSRHLIVAGGQRLRPFFVLLASQFGGGLHDDVVKAAVVVELTHLATLYHDDVMDGALMRRGVPSAHALWGERLAVRTGDFLFARASALVSELGDDAIRLQSQAFARLVEGQTDETTGPRSHADILAHHLKTLNGKTASLFALSGRLGGIAAGASPTVSRTIEDACRAWGVAYQMSDDVLDVTGDFVKLGKTPGADLREGIRTLPIIFALRSIEPSDARLVELLQYGPLSDQRLHAEALALLRAHPCIGMARAEVRKWAGIAEDEISALPESPARTAFVALCELVRGQVTA